MSNKVGRHLATAACELAKFDDHAAVVRPPFAQVAFEYGSIVPFTDAVQRLYLNSGTLTLNHSQVAALA